MNPPKIFISATSGDLSSARQIAKEALLTINCHPVEQTNFEPDWRSVTDMLRGKIGDCQALIHLVGFRYGAEPDPATLPPGTPRRSYTQMEYHLARELGLRVYTFLLPETYPFDVPAKADTSEQTQLQVAHRALIQSSPHLYEKPANDLDLRTRIIALQEKVIHLEQEQQSIANEVKTTRHWGLWAAAAILLILGGLGLWQWQMKKDLAPLARGQEQFNGQISRVQKDVTEVKNIFTQERKFMARIIGRLNERIKDWETMSPAQRFDLALDEISTEENIPSQELRDLLDLYVQRIEADPEAEFLDQYYVLIRKQAYNEAAKLANTDGQTAESRMNQHAARRKAAKKIQTAAAEQENTERLRAIASYLKAGDAHSTVVQNKEALTAYEKAIALIDKKSDPIGWSDVQGEISLISFYLAKYDVAEPLMMEVISLRKQHLNPNHLGIATALNNLALLLKSTNRLKKAEPLYREALKIDLANSVSNHINVARDLSNLGVLLGDTNRPKEALKETERAVDILKKAYGEKHPLYGSTLANLASCYANLEEWDKAESLYKDALGLVRSVYGPNHIRVATILNNFSRVLVVKDDPKEAEKMLQNALEIKERNLGLNHPSVAVTLNNLVALLQKREDWKGSEQLIWRALKIDESNFGPDHPQIAFSLNNLARTFQGMGKLNEAEPLSLRVVGIFFSYQARNKHRHPNIISAIRNYILLSRVMSVTDKQVYVRLDNLRLKAGLEAETFELIWKEVLN